MVLTRGRTKALCLTTVTAPVRCPEGVAKCAPLEFSQDPVKELRSSQEESSSENGEAATATDQYVVYKGERVYKGPVVTLNAHEQAARDMSDLRSKWDRAERELDKVRARNDDLEHEVVVLDDTISALRDHLAEQVDFDICDRLVGAEYHRIKIEHEFDEMALELVDMKEAWLEACEKARYAELRANFIEAKFNRYRSKMQEAGCSCVNAV